MQPDDVLSLSRDEIRAALSLWRDGAVVERLVDFLDEVTNIHPVPVADRIAAFDNDGTFAVEKPHKSLTTFLAHRAPTGTSRVGLLPALAARVGAVPFLARDVDEYAADATDFLAQYRHPRFGARWPELVYAPMLQLTGLLQRLGFNVYLVSGSSRDFLRRMASSYGLDASDIIGTEATVRYRGGRLLRSRRVPRRNIRRQKPEHLWNRAGAHPLLAVGNTAEDVELLRSARFAAIVRHDDEREYRYRDARLERMAKANGWAVISMRDCFASVFAPGTIRAD